jgi:hypothetical protein
MLTKELSELKQDLVNTLQGWSNDNCEGEGWGQIGYVGQLQAELMAEAAFNVLLTIKDVNDYYDKNYDLP